MAYLADYDYRLSIGDDHLAEILEEAVAGGAGQTPAQVRAKAESLAQSTIVGYLGEMFDMATEFAKNAPANIDDADDRDQNNVNCMVQITIYYIHRAIASDFIPELRLREYKDCLSWLDKIAKGEFNSTIPQKTDADGNEDSVLIGTLETARKFVSLPYSDPQVIDERNYDDI